MGKIVAVGGVNPPSSLDLIDEEIIKLASKENPKILFISIASRDDLNYCKRYMDIYEGKFKCKFETLFMFCELPSEEIIREKIFSSDIIYIGGGSVIILMEYFKRYNMKEILNEAYEKGIVLAGISSGAICWGEHYFSSEGQENFRDIGFNDYEKIDCLGFLQLLICPHYNLEGYNETVEAMVKQYNLVGIALDNNCAIEFVDNTYRIISTNCNANAYKVYQNGAKINKEIIIKDCNFKSMNELVRILGE